MLDTASVVGQPEIALYGVRVGSGGIVECMSP
jgi:hypothetical protein